MLAYEAEVVNHFGIGPLLPEWQQAQEGGKGKDREIDPQAELLRHEEEGGSKRQKHRCNQVTRIVIELQDPVSFDEGQVAIGKKAIHKVGNEEQCEESIRNQGAKPIP